ncbi:DUF5615 family PIN-like protein [Nocardioides sp. Bht2]|uniref:DUF5615 family PIN-like protein n=1 Tax=Nocardioides sp. Bht2 TaxID=3392297 RepID=UPI0039B448E2
MRILVDQNLPRSLQTQLAEFGHDCLHTSEVGLGMASDPEVFKCCEAEGRLLITGDKKLTKYLAESGGSAPSLVIVRGFSGSRNELLATLVSTLPLIESRIRDQGEAIFSVAVDRPTRGATSPPVEVLSRGG